MRKMDEWLYSHASIVLSQTDYMYYGEAPRPPPLLGRRAGRMERLGGQAWVALLL